ncbi:hypothetical protein ELI42_25520 (plasmid) [Rhizobium ruizarguesonis]|nr:hypothetical protein ELI42_25520 [Rhizobium ruizarguesonis]
MIELANCAAICCHGSNVFNEIKRMSFLLIDERQGLRPRLISRLFKDISLTSGSGRLQGLLRYRNPNH